jgi:hypothetical protein
MFDASPPIIVLILAAVFCSLWAWRRSWRESSAWRDLIQWVQVTHPVFWNDLPRVDRFFDRHTVNRLYHNGGLDDPEFRRRVEAIRAMPSVIFPLLAGAAAIALVFVGVQWLGWTW